MKKHVHIHIVALVTSMLLALLSTSVSAVDEEYFIPYTDNYGYEYDPETGTYVKNDPPAPVPQQQSETAVSHEINSVASIPSETTQTNTSNEEDSASFQLAILIASLVGILALTMVLAKTLRKQDS